jgi:hypothetical protein
MIYHRLAYLLILHHRDHMHNMNHKDFLRVVTGFRIKVGNIWECCSKAIETSGAKIKSIQARIYKTCKTSYSIQQLSSICIFHVQTNSLFRRNYKHGQFVISKAISSITSLLFLFFFFFFFINNGTHELRMRTCSISPVIAKPQI